MDTKTKQEALAACDELDQIFEEMLAKHKPGTIRYKLAAHKRYYKQLGEIYQALERTNPPQDD